MAACGSLRPLFENRPIAENSTLMDSLPSWNPIKPMHPIDQPSFNEIFGELHFKENPESHEPALSYSTLAGISSTSALDGKIVSLDHPRGAHEEQAAATESRVGKLQNQIFANPVGLDVGTLSPGTPSSSPPDHRDPCSKSPGTVFLPKNSESLHLCTEGLGFESSDDMEDSKSESGFDWSGGGAVEEEEVIGGGQQPVAAPLPRGCSDVRTRSNLGKFPPPISVIGSSGKPWVCFRGYKGGGRFVLKELRIPTYELLHASREDGRLKLHLIQPEDTAEDGVESEGAEAGKGHRQQEWAPREEQGTAT